MDFQKEIENWVEDHRKEIIEFACELISTPSVNPPGDETKVLSLISKQLQYLGVKEQKILAKEEKRPNLISEIHFQSQGPTLMYNGHMDTKPPGELSQWNTDPFIPEIKHGFLYGLGSVDMKSCIAAMVYSACAIKEFEKELSGNLLLLFSADEEAGGTFGAEFLSKENKLRADIGLIGEPSGITRDWEYLHLVSRGETCFVITVLGTQMHSSISDTLPSINANQLAAEIMLRMQNELKINYVRHPLCPKGITLTVGVLMHGGVFYGIFPGKAEFSTEIRVIPGMTKNSVEEDIVSFVARLKKENPELRIEWHFEKPPLDWINPVEVNQDHPFVRILENVAKKLLPEAPTRGAFPAWTDARFFKDIAGIPTIPAFGPGLLTQAHKPNEHLRVQSIIEATKIYALAGVNYFGLPIQI
jgi:acetylornithine deacetylase/succinyl-diaminopimelate desuccinylase family protein